MLILACLSKLNYHNNQTSEAGLLLKPCHWSRYEKARMRQISENRRLMAELGLGGGILKSPGGAPRAATAVRVKRPSKRKAPVEPSRRSSRLKGEDAADIYVSHEMPGARLSISGSGSAALLGDMQVESVRQDIRHSRLPEESLSLESTAGSEEYGPQFLSTLRKLSSGSHADAGKGKGVFDSDVLKYAGRLANLRLGASNVAKVCPDRVYSVAVHPSSDEVVVTCGDKCGNLGMWRVGHDDDDDAIVQYRPHTRCINSLEYHPTNASKLYSSSYDGTVRCLDVVAGAFDFVTSIQEDEGWLQHAALSPEGHTLYMADSEGGCRSMDLRSGKMIWHVTFHERKANTVSVHPTSPHYLVTASLDRTVRLWDVRSFRKSRQSGTKELSLLPDTRSVNSASFSPKGDRIVTVSQSHRLCLYVNAHTKEGTIDPTHSIPHDNQTGRWLAVFHACWDPKTDHSFAVGSMSRPRQAEVYTTDGGVIRRIMSLQDPEWMNSVQSRLAFHSTRDVLVACNSSGRVHTFQ